MASSTDNNESFPRRLQGKKVVIFCDFQFEDMEVLYPKIRLEEEGALVTIVGGHAPGMKYTGKYGYPVVCDQTAGSWLLETGAVDALVLPGGFAPDYMRRNAAMLAAISSFVSKGIPVASICHGPWMLCSARTTEGRPVVEGRRATSFVAIKDDVVNAGAIWVDEPVVVDGPLITSRTPQDLVPFVQTIITEVLKR